MSENMPREQIDSHLERFRSYDESKTPEERLQDHLGVLETVSTTRTVSGNLQTYMIGTMFYRFMEQPDYYVPKGEDVPGTAKDVAEIIGVNSAHITRGKKLVQFYSLEDFRKYAILPQTCLQKATELNPKTAHELLDTLLEKKKKGELSRGKATERIEKKVEEIKALSEADDGGGDDDQGDDGESLEPPVDDLEKAADKLMEVADDILEKEDHYLFTQEHRANIEGVYFGAIDRLKGLKKMVEGQNEDLE